MKHVAGSTGLSRSLAWLWLASAVALGAWLFQRWTQGLRLETSILALLPAEQRDPSLQQLYAQSQGDSARRLIALVGHADPERAESLAAKLVENAERSGLFAKVEGRTVANREAELRALYDRHRFQVLPSKVVGNLEREDPVEATLARIFDTLASPLSAAVAPTLDRDPLLLGHELQRDFARLSLAGLGNSGFLCATHDGRTYAVVTMTTAADPFDAGGSDEAVVWMEATRETMLLSASGVDCIFSGVPRFASHYRSVAQREFGLLGIGSTLATLLSIWLVLRSWRPLMLSVLPMAMSVLAGTCACFVLFEEVHTLSLVFGSTLTGLGVDYALHYFFIHRDSDESWDPNVGLRVIFPAITVGALTSIVGFSGLYLTPFPVLQQFAVFSCAGLLAAWLTVVVWFPPLSRFRLRNARFSPLTTLSRRWLGLWADRRAYVSVRAAMLAAAFAACWFIGNANYSDDIRALQSAPQQLLDDESRSRSILSRVDESKVVVVEGETEDEVLERLAVADSELRHSVARGELAGIVSLAPFIPSQSRQRANSDLVRRTLLPNFQVLEHGLDELGFHEESLKWLREDIEVNNVEPLTVSELLSNPISEPLRGLWLESAHSGISTVILLQGVSNARGLASSLEGIEGVRFIDRIDSLTGLMRALRSETMRLVGLAYLGVLSILMLRFGPRAGVRTILPALVSAGTTLAVLSAFGVPLSLFHVLGQLLVLGLAVDYGAFLAEDRASAETTFEALMLSAWVTVIAFGAMACSSAPPIRDLGASVSVGIILALALSPSAWRGQNE